MRVDVYCKDIQKMYVDVHVNEMQRMYINGNILSLAENALRISSTNQEPGL